MKEQPLKLPNGAPWRPSEGSSATIIVDIVEKFGPRFMRGGVLLYASDESGEHMPRETEYLAGLGILLADGVPMPNVVVHMPEENWLVLIDAAPDRGAMTRHRCDQLEKHFGGRARLVFVTAFARRADMAEQLEDIAWGTEAWAAEEPGHRIQFDGRQPAEILAPRDRACRPRL